ncbi:ribosome-recycling factor, mitochondrial, partial [Asbolus verrucosus]
GKEHKLQELAQIVRKNPKTIVINMAVFPQAIPAALKAIQKSGMNLNPQQDGTTLFIPIPKITTEHRENLAKNAKSFFIKCRDAVRDVQTKQVKNLKKKDKISQDVARNAELQIISIADGFISQAEKILESKQKELTGND